ncbi:MAG: efflux RND transporter permease subunit, partial [Candidatus Sedimenticola sp. (ex Thyasira tokunagai)]
VTANNLILAEWEKVRDNYPSINLDLTGELDDIQESIDSILVLFLFGIGLMYMILGTQFKSYFQPLMIIATVPMAFTGVVAGLWITDNPLSLFTLYGVVALSGIAVNAAIVLISAANERLDRGMSVLHATLYAARRRVIPILITSMTTIAGLFSLATGLGGHSLMWGPVATAIVWGLLVSTVLTLFVIPLLYRIFMGFEWVVRRRASAESE